jgi:bidirectional [NiFe] hydrogenase diaphorase subunit
MQNRKLDLPNEDKRWRIVGATMRKHGFHADALIETLHTAQTAFGYLDDQSLRWVAQNLRIPLSRVYGVATFYNYFTMKPQGEHTCVVCLGTACYIKGAPQILKALHEREGIKAGETSADKQVSLLVARCIGACGLAPAVVYDGDVAGKQEAQHVMTHIDEWRAAHVTG